MQELINKLIKEAGLSPEQANHSLKIIVDFVKTKLPPGLAPTVDAMFSGTMHEPTYKEKAEDFAGATKDKLEDLAEVAKEKLAVAADKAEDLAKEALEKFKGMFGNEKNS